MRSFLTTMKGLLPVRWAKSWEFDTLNIEDILAKVFSYLDASLICQNIIWIRAEDIWPLFNKEEHILSLEEYSYYKDAAYWKAYKNFPLIEFKKVLVAFLKSLATNEWPPLMTRKVQQSRWTLIPVPSVRGDKPLGFIFLQQDGMAPVIKKSHLEGILQSGLVRWIEFGLEHWQALHLSLRDDLTNLYNQKYLTDVLENEIKRAERSKSSFSVLFLDVDHFKQVNDTKGHCVGSMVLVELGQMLSLSVRSCDYAFRYGGDEFLLVLVDCSSKEASQVGERIRKNVEATSFLIDGQVVQLTVSIGLATFPEHAKTTQQVIKLADEAMYYGKNKSRNIVYIAS